MSDGLCQCGCGRATSIAKWNIKRLGHVKGMPVRFIVGHGAAILRGRKCTRPQTKPQPYVNAVVNFGSEQRKVREHVLVAERALGRLLPAGAEVHHVDGNGHNNANANLVICQDRGYHMLLHQRQRMRERGGNPNTDYWCGVCRTVQPLGQFWRRKTGRLIAICRACSRLNARRYDKRSA